MSRQSSKGLMRAAGGSNTLNRRENMERILEGKTIKAR